jgi:hypothetical protein
MGLAELFDISLDRANDLYAWGWRLSVFGAALTMIGIAALWMGTRVRDRDFETQMASVNLSSSKALERAGALEKDAAMTRERAAKAELKLEQLRTLAAARWLDFDIFLKELEGQPKKRVAIWYLPDISDGWSLSRQLQGALLEAGWDAEEPIPIPDAPRNAVTGRDEPKAMAAGGQPGGGITVVGREREVLSRALSKSMRLGITGSGGSQTFPVPPGTLRVVIAAKYDPIPIPPELIPDQLK